MRVFDRIGEHGSFILKEIQNGVFSHDRCKTRRASVILFGIESEADDQVARRVGRVAFQDNVSFLEEIVCGDGRNLLLVIGHEYIGCGRLVVADQAGQRIGDFRELLQTVETGLRIVQHDRGGDGDLLGAFADQFIDLGPVRTQVIQLRPEKFRGQGRIRTGIFIIRFDGPREAVEHGNHALELLFSGKRDALRCPSQLCATRGRNQKYYR